MTNKEFGGSTLPLWQCHKQVRGAKILRIFVGPDGFTRLQLENAPDQMVDNQYMLKHQPEPGGYFVVYEDGYMSFSPKAAFENGYTELNP